MRSLSKIDLFAFAFLFFLAAILAQNPSAWAVPVLDQKLPKPEEITLTSEKDIPRHIWIAKQYLRAGGFESVISICEQVLNIEKNNVEAHALLAAAHKALGNEEEFQKEAKFAQEVAPRSPALYLSLAQTYLYLEDFRKAEDSYKKGLETASEKTELHMDLAALYAGRGQLKEASDQYQEVLKRSDLPTKDFLNANFALCRIVLQNRSYDEVIKRAKTLTDLYPPIPQGYLFLVAAHLGKEETEQAINVYKKLMKANPESPVSYQELALLYIDKLSDYQNALHYAKEGVRKFPEDAKSQDVLGWVYYNKEKYSEALKQFQTADRLTEKNPMYLYHLGLAYQKMGDKARAKGAFEQASGLIEPKQSQEFAEELKSRIDQCR